MVDSTAFLFKCMTVGYVSDAVKVLRIDVFDWFLRVSTSAFFSMHWLPMS